MVWPQVILSPGTSKVSTSFDIGPRQLTPKRRKIDTACELCRLRKSRCDGARPKCEACTRRKDAPDTCTYLELPRREQVSNGNPSPQSQVDRRRESGLRIDESNMLHDRPTHMHRPKSLYNSGGEVFRPSQASMPAPPALTHLTHESQSQDSSGAETGRHSAPLVEDDLDGDNEASAQGDSWIVKAGLLGASSSSSFIRSIYKAVSEDETAKADSPAQKASQRHASNNAANEKRIRSMSVHSEEYVLPSRKVADRLLEIHWKCSHIPWLDRLHLMKWYEGLWDGRQDTNHDIDEQLYYCILNIVFALSYREDPTMNPEDRERMSEAHFIRAQKLFSVTLLDISYIEIVQALLLMAQYLQSTNMTRHCFQCVGLAILVAQNLRLHIPQTTSSIRDQHDREMARRAWHGCVLMDRITSMTFGQPTRVSQEVARQVPFPEAIDDENLGHGDSEGTQPTGQPSKLLFFVAFCKLHIILGDILSTFYHGRTYLSHGRSSQSDAATSNQNVNKIIEFDNALNCWYANLERELRVDFEGTSDSRLHGQAVNLHTRYLHIRMLLYRTFFSQSSETKKRSAADHNALRVTRFAEIVTCRGLLTAVEAAQEILDLISLTVERGYGIEDVPPWWHVITYVYTAVTILIAAHLFPSVVEQVSTAGLSVSIQQGLRILTHYETEQKSAQRCKAALDVLYDKITSSREEKILTSPNGTRLPPDPNADVNFDWDFSTNFAWDPNPSDLFGGFNTELHWLDRNTFDTENNNWL